MTGLFDSPSLLTPAQRQETVVRKALELRRQFWAPPHDAPTYLYKGAGDLLLQHGQFYSGRELPEQYKHLMGPERHCFQNALAACEADASLRYVEGVYTLGAGHFTPHAWALDPEGRLLELTMPTDPETVARAGEFTTRLPFLTPDHWGYWGAVFHPEFVRAIWAGQNDTVGILDRPIHDADEGVFEDRYAFPVFTVPYSPDRRSL